jgi:hypothetical protein
LHLSKLEKAQFKDIVEKHPKVGALGLVVGLPGLNGPGKSVAEISPILMNVDQVWKERQNVKTTLSITGETYLDQLAAFDQHHPGFLIHSQVGTVTVLDL